MTPNAFLTLNFNHGFILEHIVRNTFCGELSFSVLYYGRILPQKFTCNWRFFRIMRNSKQRLKGNSVLEIFVEKFFEKIVNHLLLTDQNSMLLIELQRFDWLQSLKQAMSNCLLWKHLLWKLQIRTSRPEVFCKSIFWNNLQNSYKTPVSESAFSIKLETVRREHLSYKEKNIFYEISPGDCF